MFRRLFKSKRAQNTAEYALLIALVVAGVIAMQLYAQRSLQARVRDAAKFMTDDPTVNLGAKTAQYEPYYQNTAYEITSDSVSTKRLAQGTVAMESGTNRTRLGNETADYTNSVTGVIQGI